MGLFDFIADIWDGVKTVVGVGAELVGTVFGSETVTNWGKKLQGEIVEKVSEEKSYDKREANVFTTDRLNETLVAFSEGYLQQAVSIERQCIQIVEAYYDRLIELAEKSAEKTKNTANLRTLKAGKSKISKSITGQIRKPLSKRMSLDDAECLRILKLDSGNAKKVAMTDFTAKVMREALNNLSQKVRSSFNEQTEDVMDYFNTIMEEQEKAARDAKMQLDSIRENFESERSDKEKSCVMPIYLTDLTKCVTNILK